MGKGINTRPEIAVSPLVRMLGAKQVGYFAVWRNRRGEDGDTRRQLRREMARVQKPTVEEERELVRRMLEGSAEAREELIERNMPLVVHQALRMRNRGLSLRELVEEGRAALGRAISSSFDPRYRISTRATRTVREGMATAIREDARMVAISRADQQVMYHLKGIRNRLHRTLGTEPSEDEVLDASLNDIKKTQEGQAKEPDQETLQEARKLLAEILRGMKAKTLFEKPLHDGDGSSPVSLLNGLADKRFPSPEEGAERGLLRERIELALSILPLRERKIITSLYMLNGAKREKTPKEVASEIRPRVSGTRIGQIEKQALRRLKVLLQLDADTLREIKRSQKSQKRKNGTVKSWGKRLGISQNLAMSAGGEQVLEAESNPFSSNLL